MPTGREEAWRFTPLARLKGLHNGTAGASGHVVVDVDAAPEVTVETVGRDDARIGKAYVPADRVSAQAYNAFEKATVITVPREAVASKETVITLTGAAFDAAGGAASYGHIVVKLEPLSEAIVVLDHKGSAVYADNVEFVVGEGASLKVVSVQEWDDDAVHVSHHHAQLAKDATFKSFVVTLGGDVVRLSPSVSYTGPGGDADLSGVYFVDAKQHLEHRLLVDHSQPNCKSNVDYRGALQGEEAHAVWIGDVIIRVAAEGTDTYELNRNLLLTDGARADSVPNLEILTGEVAGAGHASTSGRLDDEHLFYLQARGIPFDEARRLVIRGFLGQLIEKIEIEQIRDRVMSAVEAELAR